jgi:putative ABC transport system permease protein
VVIRNYLRQFYRDIRTQRLRFFLTLFGMVWGTVSVTLLLAFGQGIHEQMIKESKGIGENIVICWPSRTSKPFKGMNKGRLIRMTEEDMEYLRREVPEIDSISPEYSTGSARYTVGKKTLVPWLSGVWPEYAAMRSVIPDAKSRYINATDLAERRRVIFLGNKLKEDFFGKEEAIGEKVEIEGVPFQVIGVMEPKSQDSSYRGRDEDTGTIPATVYRDMFGKKYVDNFIFQVNDPTLIARVKKGVVAAAARKYNFDPEDKEAVGMWDTTETSAFFNTFFLAFRLFLCIVGALTLVVGGIGVSNIMNVVVEERTKEIGIKMALGAKKGYIVGQFMFETFFITLLGAALGFLLSAAICKGFPPDLHKYVGDPRISLQVTLITTGVLGAIAFLAGWFPARAAANLNPVQALKFDI